MYTHRRIGSIGICLTLTATFVLTISALSDDVLFQDDFNDGSYTDSWTIDWSHTGNPTGDPTQRDYEPQEVICDGDDCYLRGHTTQDSGHNKNAPVLYTMNPTDVGSWQFDSRLLSSEKDSGNFILLHTSDKSFSGDSYFLLHTPEEISLQKRTGRTFEKLITGPSTGQDDQWHMLELTRDTNGLWRLFADQILIGEAADRTFTELPYLMVGRYGDFDNVIVTAG